MSSSPEKVDLLPPRLLRKEIAADLPEMDSAETEQRLVARMRELIEASLTGRMLCTSADLATVDGASIATAYEQLANDRAVRNAKSEHPEMMEEVMLDGVLHQIYRDMRSDGIPQRSVQMNAKDGGVSFSRHDASEVELIFFPDRQLIRLRAGAVLNVTSPFGMRFRAFFGASLQMIGSHPLYGHSDIAIYDQSESALCREAFFSDARRTAITPDTNAALVMAACAWAAQRQHTAGEFAAGAPLLLNTKEYQSISYTFQADRVRRAMFRPR